MALKVGDTCWQVHVDDAGKIEFWEYHLRTIRTRPHGTRKIGYWFPKLPGTTWGKVSTKQGDYGWLDKKNIGEFRVAKAIEDGRPFGTTKAGIVRSEIADCRDSMKKYPDDPELISEVTVTLNALLKAQKRLKTASTAESNP